MIASAIASIVILSLRTIVVWVFWPDYVLSPDHFILAVKAFGWNFLIGLLAIGLMLVFMSKKPE